MFGQYDAAGIIDYLQKQPEIIPDSHDGSYELLRETVKAYTSIRDYTIIDYLDLNALYLMVIGTWKHGIERKKETIISSHLPEVEKTRLMAVIDRVWSRACSHEYSNRYDDNSDSIGMFGTGFLSFNGKTTDQCARSFVKMCVDIFGLEDDDTIYDRADQILSHNFRGMQAAAASAILHCLKPYVFPILNGNMGAGNVFEAAGVKLVRPGALDTYISNCRAIRLFRNQYFTFKNYRVFDNAARDLYQTAIGSNNITQAENYSRQNIKEKTEATLRIITEGNSDFSIESHKTQTSVRWKSIYAMSIYYRTDALRIGVKDTPEIHAIYEELSAKGVAYQKSTADPYSEPGRYSFFVDSKSIEDALMLLIIAIQDDKLTGETISTSARFSAPEMNSWPATAQNSNPRPDIQEKQNSRRIIIDDREYIIYGAGASNDGNDYPHMVDAVTGITPRGNQRGLLRKYLHAHGIETKDDVTTHWCCKAILSLPDALSENAEHIQQHFVGREDRRKDPDEHIPNTDQLLKQLQSVAAFSHSADNQRIERKIDSLIGAIASMSIPQVNKERSEPAVISKSYRIETTSGDSPVLIIQSKPIITGLVFALKISTIGYKTDPEQYRIFFSTSNCKQLSDPQEFAAVAGEEQTCRFMLKTSASEEKKIFLVVQGADAEEDEARQLIAFDVNMAFSADFDL